MSDESSQPAGGGGPSTQARHTALFTGLILQQANTAMMFLGKAPQTDAEAPAVDLQAASMFIDMLEMLEAKTRGNLSADETGMLRETLTTLRITFVEAAEAAPAKSPRAGPEAAPAQPASSSGGEAASEADAAADADARKKFVKRY